MTPTVTSTTVRAIAPQDNSVEYVNPNARVRVNAQIAGIPLVAENLFIAQDGQQYVRSLKITGNSIAEATASPGELDAYTRSLPQSLTSITFPRTLLQPSEEVVFSVDSGAQAPSRNVSESAQAASNYQRVGDITINQELAINAIA